MSYEEETTWNNGAYGDQRPVEGDEEEEEAEEEAEQAEEPSRRRLEGDEDDEEEEDEEEEEEDEEEDSGRRKKKQKRSHKRNAYNRFVDLEAQVDSEDEPESSGDEGEDGFLAEPGFEGEGEDEDVRRRSALHQRLDRQRLELNNKDAAVIAEEIELRHKRTGATRYTGDPANIPQRLLMPSVNDANLWQVRVKPGKERDICFSLMRKSIDLEFSARPLKILSAFQRDNLPGMIYIEARSQAQVQQALVGLVNVFPSRGMMLVPIEEMAPLLQYKRKVNLITEGAWVRIKRGKYQGDLAQVVDITDNGEEVGLKFIPRIDLNPKDDVGAGGAGVIGADGKKRKKMGSGLSVSTRPPQRFFNIEEVIKVYGRKSVSSRSKARVVVFQNDTFRDGYIEKDIRISGIQTEDVNPTLDEITKFVKQQDGEAGEGGETSVDLSVIADAARKAAVVVLQPGDRVEVFEGEQAGVHGTVQTITGEIVTLLAAGLELEGQNVKVEVPARSVRKKFKAGDHVKVMAGHNVDETGLVVSVADNVVTFLSDLSMQEASIVSVFSKDLREAAEVGASTNVVGNYELHDLVQLDMQTVGVIFKTERDTFRVLDQNGQVRVVHPHQITMGRDSRRAIATDSSGHELRIGDNVKEIDGENRKGQVLHIHQSFFAFLYNRELTQTGGVFVTRARSLTSVAPKNMLTHPNAKSSPFTTDLSKMNPAMTGAPPGGFVGSGAMGRGPRDRLIGVHVVVVKGTFKGYVGVIKDTNGAQARVELNTGNKVITVEKEKLKRPGQRPGDPPVPLESGRGGGAMAPPIANYARTPAQNPYSDPGFKTPAWGTSGRTPNPYSGSGSRTPAWEGSSKTPNPYGNRTPGWIGGESGRTPAWSGGESGRTPNPYASGGGGGGGAVGGRTPAYGRTPNPYERLGAPTPGVYSAPTPGIYGAPTPSFARTPGVAATPFVPGGGSESVRAPVFSTFTSIPHFILHYILIIILHYIDADQETWLLDTSMKRSGLYVTFKPCRGEHWHDGIYNDCEGVILSVMEPNSVYNTTAQIYVRSPPPGLLHEVPAVPVQFLVPVSPGLKDRAVALHGELKGRKVRIVENDGDHLIITPADEVGGKFIGARQGELCKWTDPVTVT
ncbi:transcription elongation factor Spt5 [Hysterangium stoloniferum]|nr:transcription elongation factor Spt5 [Hysterangium stoloniferum]